MERRGQRHDERAGRTLAIETELTRHLVNQAPTGFAIGVVAVLVVVLVMWRAAPLGALVGPVVAWNLLLLSTIVAAGIVTYLWLHSLDLGAWPAAIGGLVFAIAPYRLDQSATGHLLGWVAIFIPLALLGIERARTARSPARANGWGAVTAAALASIAVSGQIHLALGAIPFVLVYALIRVETTRIDQFLPTTGALLYLQGYAAGFLDERGGPLVIR